ncbi:MAG: hypothetical protein JNM93_09210, partial [Bacteriovoracaceae bacterium]|nr:hypothetical protein [Bacteriovoracaceae bacterium]
MKIALFILIHATFAWGTAEPQMLRIVQNGNVHEVNFSNLTQTTIVTRNHHPHFSKLGEIQYTGYLTQEILKKFKVEPNQKITLVGKTGQFSVEMSAHEFLNSKNLIATHKNGVPVKTEENGLQIIYDEDSLKKYPHLAQRQYYCWWVRTIILDDKYIPDSQGLTKNKITLKTDFP